MGINHYILFFNHTCFALAIIFYSYLVVFTQGEKCIECRFLVATFKEGLNRTSKSHFGGGNTAWEERKLGKFMTSEIRFAEVMEYICKKDVLKDFYEYNTKEIQFKCHNLAEDVEESLEKWFFELQTTQPDLEAHICINELKRCCPSGHFGSNCDACPGFFPPTDAEENPRVCFGRGRCHGNGIREGSGRCDCDSGYAGKTCGNCAAHYFAVIQSPTSVECEECFDGCAGGCTSAGPKGCSACRTGYVMDETRGCQDIDECDDSEPKCTKKNEKCVNTPGSFRCDCEDGYRRNGDVCELDVEESTSDKDETADGKTNDDKAEKFDEPLDEQDEAGGKVEKDENADDMPADNMPTNDMPTDDMPENYMPEFAPYDDNVDDSMKEWLANDDEERTCGNDGDGG